MLTGTTTAGDGYGRDTGVDQTQEEIAQFASTPRGARLARRLAVRCMEEWGHSSASDVSGTVALVVGELVANAVRHGRVPGHDFRLRLVLDEAAGLVRIEVADAAAGRRPPTALPFSCPDGESGRGLLLVDALAERWGWEPREAVGKTVWAEVPVSPLGGGVTEPADDGSGPQP